MVERSTSRRNVLTTSGSLFGLAGLGVVGTVSATSYRTVAVKGGTNDSATPANYSLHFNTPDVNPQGDTEGDDTLITGSGGAVAEGTVYGDSAWDSYEIPEEASLTGMVCYGDEDGTRIEADIEDRGYGRANLSFEGIRNPGFSKITYSAYNDNGADFFTVDDVEGWPEDTKGCTDYYCSVAGQVAADYEDVWGIKGGVPERLGLNLKQQGGRAAVKIDVISP